MLIRLPQAERRIEGNSLEQASVQVERRCRRPDLPKFTIVSTRAGQRRHRRATCSGGASTRRSASLLGDHGLHRHPVPVLVCGRRHRRDAARRAGDAGVPGVLRLRPVAERRRRDPDDHRLLGERHHRHLRPRAREPASRRREPLDKIVNESVNQTLSRTIITAGTTFLSVLSIFLFGGEALRGFAFTMLVGIVSGTYSTIFIASAIAIILSGGKARGRVAATALVRRRRPGVAGRNRSEPRRPSRVRKRLACLLRLTYLLAAVLGIVQGLTEFLPISSTAHLLLVGKSLGFQDPGGVFTVMIQFGRCWP